MKKKKRVTYKDGAEGSLIAIRFNLACEDGHRHYAPEPMVFVDHECGAKKKKVIIVDGIRKRVSVTCKKKLKLMRHSRDIPKKRKKSKLYKIPRY